MQSFDVVTLRVFLAVLRTGSIGAAAKAEHIAASAISRRISELEHSQGVALVHRTPAGVNPTPAGKVFGEHCEILLGQMTGVRADLRQYADGEAGEFRIGAVASVICGALPDLVTHFQEQFPGVEVTLTEIFSEDSVRRLREDQFDLIITSDMANTRGFQTMTYGIDPVWVFGPLGHALFKGKKRNKAIPFTEAAQYDLVYLHEGGSLDELISTAMRKLGSVPTRKYRMLRTETLRSCVRAGLGLGFARQSSVASYIEDKGVLGAPLSDSWANRRLFCVFPKAKDASPVLAAFLDMLEGRGD